MKNFNKIVSTLLAVLMLLSSFGVSAFAEDEVLATGPAYEYDTNRQTLNYITGEVLTYDEDGKQILDSSNKPVVAKDESGDKIIIDTAVERLELMDLRLEKDGHRLYIDAYTGEIAVENIASGEVMFSNPYDVGSTTSADTIKAQLLSQIVVRYTDVTSADESVFYSFTEAAERGQIDIRNIKNGIRVEYSIGREQSKMLVPMLIEKTSFEEKILTPLKEGLGEESYEFRKFNAFYMGYSREAYSGQSLTDLETKYPIFKKMDFYVIDDTVNEVDLARLEQNIKTYAPDYTFDNLDEDHLLTGYESEDDNPPLFRMALEYTLDEDGLCVRLPANGIRFNETLYRLTSLDILPWMGAAANPGAGYTFFPDGSGTLFDFEKIQESGASTTITGKVYGDDFAYHTITSKLQEEIRYPVYGIVDSFDVVAETGEEYFPDPSVLVPPEIATKYRGFVAIVEEGEAMMEISTYHEVRSHKYNAVKVTVYPRPQDTYNIADAISVGSNKEWTVVSSRKYTGSYRLRYTLLTPDDVAAEKGIEDYYECTYVGMALAYRNYLIEKGILNKLTSEDVGEDIPLYIETFGTMPTTEKILSVPVTVMTPLTSFEDIQTMYNNFSDQGITNINFIMTGYANGGMYADMPYNLKWEKAVGGKSGFEDLLSYAKQEGFGLYPDFDFAYISSNSLFDGVTLKNHAVKTIDNRYANKREYSATKQTQLSYFELVISPAYFNRFYEKLTSKYAEYDPIGISVSTLGNSLNSDFDEDEPYNREDAKSFTEQALAYFQDNYDNVMISGGNSFTWKYVDHITDIALDSSRYSQAGAAVPFLGIVLHGYVQLAGTAINMEGNIDYSLLKAIENGSSVKFILSYRNTDNLKDFFDLSQYYSIRYDIWFDDVVSIYNELNNVLADVQTSAITDHKFVEGTRIPDADELISDAQALIAEAVKIENELLDVASDAERVALLNARISIISDFAALETTTANINTLMDKLMYADATGEDGTTIKVEIIEHVNGLIAKHSEAVALLEVLSAELAELEKDPETNKSAITAKKKEVTAQTKAVSSALNNLKKFVTTTNNNATKAINAIDAFKASAENAKAGYELLVENGTTNTELLEELKTKSEAIVAAYEAIKGLRDDALNLVQTDFFNAVDGKLEDFVKYEDPALAVKEEEVEDEETDSDRYTSDDDRIVYVEYENGVAFLLNFNNYRVRTEFNGTVYTIGAYGYLVIGSAN